MNVDARGEQPGHPHRLRFGVLGSLEVSRGGVIVKLGAPKQRQVLGILLANAGSVVSTDRLIDEIWGVEQGPDRQNALWVHVSNLRKSLRAEDEPADADVLITKTPGYTVDLGDSDYDARDFERLVAEGHSLIDVDPAASSIVFAEALALWRGRAYADFFYEPWAQPELTRLEELRLGAVESRIDADLRRGLSRELTGELEGLVREHPTREGLTASLMVALHRSGRSAEALRAYQTLGRHLGDELGIEASARLRDLRDRIVTQDPALDAVRTHSSPGGDATGPAVRGYEIRERLGERGSGVLYRGFQPAVGRNVMVKVIRPEFADDPSFVRRFEAEAQLIARLEHPHIVPLYDYWREPGAAYLVMRSIRGGSLADVLAHGPLATDALASLVEQVGAALSTAHRNGVVHGHVSVDNVLMDDVGNAYLTDFEPTSSIRTETAVLGRPAPAGEGASVASGPAPGDDLCDFAVIVARAATGRIDDNHPDDITELIVGLDGLLADVLRRATLGGIESEFEGVEGFVQAVTSVLRGGGSPRPVIVGENPYKGLRSFGFGDASNYFGRERFVERLVERLGRAGRSGRFLAVVGPSGSGKSSVVHAGLLPALRAGAAPGSEAWFIAEMVPGAHPFEQLEKALGLLAVRPPASLLTEMTGQRAIQRAVDRVLPGTEETLVLVVDQFEELFAQRTPVEAARFIDALCEAADDDLGRIRLVVTLRADFYDHPLRHRALAELLRIGTELLTPMSPEELERAISLPAERAGAQCEPALVGELVAAVVNRPAALPLLQYTLTELFERRTGTTVTSEAYHEIGGVAGALVERAEAILQSFGPAERNATQQIFLRLVTLGEASPDTRRRVLMSELATITGVGPYADVVTDTFGRHRLLSFDRDPTTRTPTVEIAHESLLTEWGRLQQWIDDARSDVGAERQLADAAREWVANDCDDAFALAGARLARYRGWSDNPPIGLTAGEQGLLVASEEAERRRQEIIVEQERRELQLHRRSMVIAGLATVTVAVLALASFAVVQQRRATNLATEARVTSDARRVAAAAQVKLTSDPELATMLAIEASRISAAHGKVPPEVMDALHAGIQATRTPYPPDPGDVAVRGLGGVFVMSPDDLVALAQSAVTRPLTSSECTKVALNECGDPRDPVASGLVIEGGEEAYAGTPRDGQPLAGTQVELITAYVGDQKAALEADLAAFSERTGIDVVIKSERLKPSNENRFAELEGDVVHIPQPAAVADVADDAFIDLTDYISRDSLEQGYGSYLTSMLSRGDNGSWPSASGPVYGVWISLDNKSLLFHSADLDGTSAPATWDDALALSDRLIADGRTPWCLGVFNGGDGDGWPGTDLIERYLLSAEGPEFYDAWWRHEVPFNHPAVVEAARAVGALAFTPGYVYGGAANLSRTMYWAGVHELEEESPRCAMTPGWSFTLPDAESFATIGVTAFPIVEPQYENSIVAGGTYLAATVDRPEVRALMQFFASPDFGAVLVEMYPGFIPPHRGFDLGVIPGETHRKIAQLTHDALDAGRVRFDASDLMPPEVGQGDLWAGMLDWFELGPDSIDGILSSLEEKWLELEANGDT